MRGSGARSTFLSGLFDWSGNRSGGVRRLFDERSGRPGGIVIETPLIKRLGSWARSFGDTEVNPPSIVLLVGGPGNGKTEAIELTIFELDTALGCSGLLSMAWPQLSSRQTGRYPVALFGRLGRLRLCP